jgi:hypothetical protein
MVAFPLPPLVILLLRLDQKVEHDHSGNGLSLVTQAAPPMLVVSSNTRQTDVLDSRCNFAIWRMLNPRWRSRITASRLTMSLGRPMCMPYNLARRMPERTRSIIRLRSSSATALRMTMTA